jgi:hypothetical protein
MYGAQFNQYGAQIIQYGVPLPLSLGFLSAARMRVCPSSFADRREEERPRIVRDREEQVDNVRLFYIMGGGRKSVTLLKDAQSSPARPSNRRI